MEITDFSNNSRLRIALTCSAIEKNLTFPDYKLISEWLECYEYIQPKHRILHTNLLESLLKFKLAQARPPNKSVAFKIWYYSDLVESCLNSAEQLEVAKWMKESNNYLTLPLELCISVRANSNCIV